MTSANAGGAHLTGIAAGTRPSIFEIISQEGFSTALKPAASHIIKVLAETNPDGRFAVAYSYFDELYLTFDAIVQWHYILTRGATLSEAFYGLERKLATVGTPRQNLFRIRLSYTLSVVLPYVSAKLDKLIYSTHNISNEQIQKSNPRTFKQKTIQQIYTYLKTALKSINVVYLLAYVFGRSDYHNLTFRLLNMTLGYTSEERSKFMEEKQAELWMLSEWKNPKLLPKLLFRTLGESILFAVEVGTFFIQFLEWWNNDPKRSKIATGFSKVPLPPSDSKRRVQNMVKLLPSDMNKCPICRKSIRNPTVISVSGVVYCYGCIFPQLRQNNVCPLTNLPGNINHLIRVYQ